MRAGLFLHVIIYMCIRNKVYSWPISSKTQVLPFIKPQHQLAILIMKTMMHVCLICLYFCLLGARLISNL